MVAPITPSDRRRAVGLILLASLASPLVGRAEDKTSTVDLGLVNFWNNPGLWSPTGEPQAGDNIFIGTAHGGPLGALLNAPISFLTTLPDTTVYGTVTVDGQRGDGSFTPFGPLPETIFNRGILLPALVFNTTAEAYGSTAGTSGYFLQTGGEHHVTTDVVLGGAGIGVYLLEGVSLFDVGRDLIVGDRGEGYLQTLGGPLLVGRDLWFGREAGSLGSAKIAGDVRVANDLILGGAGDGFMTLGGNVEATHQFVIGQAAGGKGTLDVLGGGAVVSIGDLIIGDAGEGALTLTAAGALAHINGTTIIGRSPGGVGRVENLFGGMFNTGGDLIVGDSGDGAYVSRLTNMLVIGNAVIGRAPGGTGAWSSTLGFLTVDRDLVIGDAGSGQLHLLTTPTSVGGDVVLGRANTGEGLLTLEPLELLISGSLVVGDAGSGTLELGGTSSVGVIHDVTLGASATGRGTVKLFISSSLSMDGTLRVGQRGEGTLILSSSGTLHDPLEAASLIVAEHSGSTGTVQIHGGSVRITHNASIGLGGVGTWIQEVGTTSIGGTWQFGSAEGGVGNLIAGDTTLEVGRLVIHNGDLQIAAGTLAAPLAEQWGGNVVFGPGLELRIGDTGAMHISEYRLADGRLEVPTLRIAGGSFHRTGGELVTDHLIFEGGSVSGLLSATGEFTLAPLVTQLDAELRISGSFDLDHAFTATGGFDSSGTTRVRSGGVLSGEVTLSGGSMTVEDGGEVDTSALEVTGGHFSAGPGSTVQAPLLTVTGGALEIGSGATFVGGEILVSGTGELTFTGTPTLDLADATLTIGTAGTVAFDTTSEVALPSHVTVTGVDRLESGLGADNARGGLLTGSADLRLTSGSTLDLHHGWLEGTGRLWIDEGATMSVTASDAKLDRPIVNAGLVRMNVGLNLNHHVAGSSHFTNLASGALHLLDAPLDSGINAIWAEGLAIDNAGTVTVGSADFPGTTWFATSAPFNNTGTLSLEGQSTLVLGGGGTQAGTVQLGTHPGSELRLLGGHTIHDSGATFSGAGRVVIEGGTLLTAGGVYSPGYDVALVGELPALPGVTELTVSRRLGLAADVSTLPMRVTPGAQLDWASGRVGGLLTVEAGGRLEMRDFPGWLALEPTTLDGTVDNAGIIGWGDPVEGTGTLYNRPGGQIAAIALHEATGPFTFSPSIVNDGSISTHRAYDPAIPLPPELSAFSQTFGEITNRGDFTFSTGAIFVGQYRQESGTTVIDATQFSAASFDIAGGSVVATGQMDVGDFTNRHAFTVGTAGLHFAGAFQNLEGGELILEGGLHVALDSDLISSNQGHIILEGAHGDVWRGGSRYFSGGFTAPAGGMLTLRHGRSVDLPVHQTLTNPGNLHVGSGSRITLDAGRISNSGTLTLDDGGQLEWRSGAISGGGTLLVGTGARLEVRSGDSGDHPKDLVGQRLENAGVVDWSAAPGSLRLSGGAVVENLAGGLIDLTGGGYSNFNGGELINRAGGVIRRRVSVELVELNLPFRNEGLLDVQSGRVDLTQPGSSTGTIHVAAGAELAIRMSSTAEAFTFGGGAELTGAGTLHLLNGIQNLTTPLSFGDLRLAGGTLRLGPGGGWTVAAGHRMNWSGGALVGAGGEFSVATGGTLELPASDGIQDIIGQPVENRGRVTWSSRTLRLQLGALIRNAEAALFEIVGEAAFSPGDNTGRFVNEQGGVIVKTGGGLAAFDLPLDNQGTVQVESGTLALTAPVSQANGATLAGGTWQVGPDSTLDLRGAAFTRNEGDVWLRGHGSTFAAINPLSVNTGRFRISDGRSFTATGSFANHGTLIVDAGSVFHVPGSALSNLGTLQVSGQLTGDLISGGVLAPGSSPGLMLLQGDLTLLDSSIVLLEIAGPSLRGIEYDAIVVEGVLHFGGSLTLELLDGFDPISGQSYDLFDFDAATGTFSTLQLPALSAGLGWDLSELYSSGIVAVTGSPVPEPGLYATVAGLLALAVTVRRRGKRSPRA